MPRPPLLPTTLRWIFPPPFTRMPSPVQCVTTLPRIWLVSRLALMPWPPAPVTRLPFAWSVVALIMMPSDPVVSTVLASTMMPVPDATTPEPPQRRTVFSVMNESSDPAPTIPVPEQSSTMFCATPTPCSPRAWIPSVQLRTTLSRTSSSSLTSIPTAAGPMTRLFWNGEVPNPPPLIPPPDTVFMNDRAVKPDTARFPKTMHPLTLTVDAGALPVSPASARHRSNVHVPDATVADAPPRMWNPVTVTFPFTGDGVEMLRTRGMPGKKSLGAQLKYRGCVM